MSPQQPSNYLFRLSTITMFFFHIVLVNSTSFLEMEPNPIDDHSDRILIPFKSLLEVEFNPSRKIFYLHPDLKSRGACKNSWIVEHIHKCSEGSIPNWTVVFLLCDPKEKLGPEEEDKFAHFHLLACFVTDAAIGGCCCCWNGIICLLYSFHFQ